MSEHPKPVTRVGVDGLHGRYEISDAGVVISLLTGRELRPFLAGRGYCAVSLVGPGGTISKHYIHRLVASAFCERREAGQRHVNHIEGNKLNNAAANLEWVSPAENNRHARAAGLNRSRPPIRRGEQKPNAKISDAMLRSFRLRRAAGERVMDLAAEAGVNKSTMSVALRNKGRAG